jgi:TfoX/Sxy family transcriptional regulator of competence genes
MAYSKSLAARIQQALGQRPGIEQKRMFGGVAFLLHGNMLVGVWQDSLVARLGPEQGERALREEYVKAFDVTGRPMKGWALIEPDGIDTDEQLRTWVERATEFVSTLPPK